MMNSCTVFGLILAVASCMTASAQTSAKVETDDPLRVIAQSFPKTMEFKDKGRVLEFCPDNTCDGFVRSERVPTAELKDFAFLCAYFFSDYVYLEDFRRREAARLTAENILSRSAYRDCRGKTAKESARCVLLALSRNGRIRLIFVRYDENQRNVVNENIVEHLGKKKAQSP